MCSLVRFRLGNSWLKTGCACSAMLAVTALVWVVLNGFLCLIACVCVCVCDTLSLSCGLRWFCLSGITHHSAAFSSLKPLGLRTDKERERAMDNGRKNEWAERDSRQWRDRWLHFPCDWALSYLSSHPWYYSAWILWNALVLLNLHVCQQAFNVFKSWKMFKGNP